MESEIHYVGTNGYGLYMDWEEFVDFAVSYARQHDIPVRDIDRDDFYDTKFRKLLSTLSQIWDRDKAIEDYSIIDDQHFDGSDIYSLDCYARDGDGFVYGFVLYSYRQGRIFDNPEKEYPSIQTYKNMHEMADEFKKRIGRYLPKDFDYERHLVIFSGAEKITLQYRHGL